MAKIRVYELARSLNMTNKVLLDRLREMDIPVKSHMSSIDSDEVDRIKAGIFGVEKEQIVETRIKPTIIRRRKKVIPVEPQIVEEAVKIEAAPEAEKAPPVETIEEPAKEPEKKLDTEAAAEKTAPKKPAPRKVERKKEPAAKIVKRPEPEVVEPTPKVDEEKVPEAIEKKAPSTEITPETPEASEPEIKGEAVPDEPPETAKVQKPPAPPKPVKKKRKVKKETPAKIIKMPAPGAVDIKPAARKATVTQFPTPSTAHEAPETPQTSPDKSPAPGKKKKVGKKGHAAEQDKKFFKKKISFKRKEVVEGAALYDRGRRTRRGKKGDRGKRASIGLKTQITTAKAIKRRIKVDDTIVLSDLAKRMGIKANELIVKLMGLGVMATVNQTIDFDTAVLVAAEFDYEVEKAAFKEEAIIKTEVDDPDKLMERPPVVTVMGHVDHGKTSLLDVIRETNVTKNEAGGITQHIGAYNVDTEKGRIVFLDTPGHEAFTAMRSRGAGITDLVVLVVAADDGVMPTTLEAINHAKAAEVPIIVAINKMDKADADPDRVQRQLAEIGLTPEAWGGDTIFVRVSAKQKEGIEELLEMILLQAEVLELKANPEKRAFGRVVEARLDTGRGPVATVLVQEGTLQNGEPVVCGVHYGKVRSLLNDMGLQVDVAGPSMPVEIIGLSGVPMAGDEFIALADEKDAKQISQHRGQKQRSKELAKTSRLSLEKLFEKMTEGEVKDLDIIIKADVHGSIEALRDSLVKLSNEEVNINVVHSGTGAITETDVSLATVSDAIIIGFNVRPSPKVQAMANEENVDMRFYNVIYNVIRDVKDAISGMMASTFEEHTLGHAEVRQVFMVPKVGTIAGCYVTDGKVQRGNLIRLIRDGVVIYEGKIGSLRRFKDDAKEVMSGYECGIGIENYNDIKTADMIECYFLEEIRPEID